MRLRTLLLTPAALCLLVMFLAPLTAHRGAALGQPLVAELATQPLVNLLSLLTNRDNKARRTAARELERRRDPQAIPGLVELLRLPQIAARGEVEFLLQKLTGQNLGPHWVPWHEWLTAREAIDLPPHFLEWKAALFRMMIDPAFAKFLYPGVPLRIRIEEIVWGGVRKDGLPALDQPKLIAASEASYLNDRDLVFGVEINGDARAYPHRIMDSHELLNDVIGGQAVALAYCTLCRSGILFDAMVEGQTFTFGSSGLLYRSNKLMYDRQTESLWMTIPGEPISGRLAHSRSKLKKLPLVVTSWQAWRALHPATRVLSLETGFQRDYRPGAFYGEYFASPDLMFPAPRRDARLRPKEEVFALVVNGQAKAYPLKKLRRTLLLTDQLGGENIVLLSEAKTDAVRAYACGARPCPALKDAANISASADGSRWQITEAALIEQSTGVRLPRLAGHTAYWFGWATFYPDTLLF